MARVAHPLTVGGRRRRAYTRQSGGRPAAARRCSSETLRRRLILSALPTARIGSDGKCSVCCSPGPLRPWGEVNDGGQEGPQREKPWLLLRAMGLTRVGLESPTYAGVGEPGMSSSRMRCAPARPTRVWVSQACQVVACAVPPPDLRGCG